MVSWLTVFLCAKVEADNDIFVVDFADDFIQLFFEDQVGDHSSRIDPDGSRYQAGNFAFRLHLVHLVGGVCQAGGHVCDNQIVLLEMLEMIVFLI